MSNETQLADDLRIAREMRDGWAQHWDLQSENDAFALQCDQDLIKRIAATRADARRGEAARIKTALETKMFSADGWKVFHFADVLAAIDDEERGRNEQRKRMRTSDKLAEKVTLYLGKSVEDAVMTFAEDGSTWQELIDLAREPEYADTATKTEPLAAVTTIDQGTFAHRGGLYDLGLLFDQTKGRKALPRRVDRLWAIKGNTVPPGAACSSCKYGPKDWHEQRIAEAGLSFPVLVLLDGTILDGLHRLEKAHRENAWSLPAILVTKDDLAKSFISGKKQGLKYIIPNKSLEYYSIRAREDV